LNGQTIQQGELEMTRTLLTTLLTASSMLSIVSYAAAETTLTIESWRTDDLTIWQEKLIPAFQAKNPDIKVNFAPTNPPEYDAALGAKLEAGSAGDLITCRPFDKSLELFNKGQLADLAGLSGMENFSDVAKSAWTTDDGKATFCVPMASVIHGFIYNKDAFDKLGIAVPATQDEFFAALDKIKADGTFIPMAMGTKDQWEAATMGYQNIGPNYWKGEEGRLALIKGEQKLTDAPWVEPYAELLKWKPYLGDGFEAQTYSDSQNLFTLGRAAIYPAGSWEIALFNSQAQFKMGAFPPPVKAAGDTCYISDHTDIAIGLNPKSANADAAKKFLSWVASPEFATIYANALPGFFSLSSTPVEMQDPLAQEFVSWRQKCKSTIRSTYQILSRGTPNLENETWVESANVINGTDTPEAAAKKLQDGLDSWYKPAK
jgi:raffinose/stachyose/melibiose transport system substrate-binding protein